MDACSVGREASEGRAQLTLLCRQNRPNPRFDKGLAARFLECKASELTASPAPPKPPLPPSLHISLFRVYDFARVRRGCFSNSREPPLPFAPCGTLLHPIPSDAGDVQGGA